MKSIPMISIIVLSLFSTVLSPAQEEPQPPPMAGKLEDTEQIRKQIQKIDDHTYQIGELVVDASARQLSFPGEINMATGLAEVVVCTMWGKLHESVIRTSLQPMHLHVGLLLLGLKDGSNPGWFVPPPISTDKPKPQKTAGDQVDVFVRWKKGDQWVEKRAEELILNSATKKPLPDTGWVFTGSYLDQQGGYVADYVGSILTNYHDRSAVVDCPLEMGQSDEYMVVNSGIVPSPGTKVEVRMVARGSKEVSKQ